MITSPILEKSRIVNKILQNNAGKYVDLNEIAGVIKSLINQNIFILDLKGAILGHALVEEFRCETMLQILKDNIFPERYNELLLKNNGTTVQKAGGLNICAFFEEDGKCLCDTKFITVIPIIGECKRIGTFLLEGFENQLASEDLILAERGAAVTGVEMMRAQEENNKHEVRNKEVVNLAISKLSYSEEEAMEHVFKELGSLEGVVVTSKIADKLGFTRSSIVNVLRKFECAAIIKSSSLGVKGTYIKILNPYLIEHLTKKK
jgi:transcriptional pleiotropic repressor